MFQTTNPRRGSTVQHLSTVIALDYPPDTVIINQCGFSQPKLDCNGILRYLCGWIQNEMAPRTRQLPVATVSNLIPRIQGHNGTKEVLVTE